MVFLHFVVLVQANIDTLYALLFVREYVVYWYVISPQHDGFSYGRHPSR